MKAAELLEPLTKVYRQDFLRETMVEFVRVSDVEPIIEQLCAEIETLKKANEWRPKTIIPSVVEVGFSELLFFKDETDAIHVGWCKFSIPIGYSWLRQCDGRDFYYDYITDWKPLNN